MQQKSFLTKIVLIGLFLLLSHALPVARAQAPTDALWEMINTSRESTGVGRLAWSNLLAQAAQEHAQDIGSSQVLSHIGSDGSTPEERATRLGYQSYPHTILVAENWGTGSTSEVFAAFLEYSLNRSNMFSPLWREVGVGVAPSSIGGQIWVVVFGAQPGVFPIFINHDEPSTIEQRVTVQLRGEESVYDGSSFKAPVEMRIAEASQIANAPWQPWRSDIVLELSPGRGQKVVMAEFRDDQGRIVRSQDSIFFNPSGDSLSTPSVDLTPRGTLPVTFIPSLTSSVSPTSLPESTFIPTATAIAPLTSSPESTFTPTAIALAVTTTASGTPTMRASPERTRTPLLSPTALHTVTPLQDASSTDNISLNVISSPERAHTLTVLPSSSLTLRPTKPRSSPVLPTPIQLIKRTATPTKLSAPTRSVTPSPMATEIIPFIPTATAPPTWLSLITQNKTVLLILLVTVESIIFLAIARLLYLGSFLIH